MSEFECNKLLIGERLKEARTKSKWSPTQLVFAEEIGASVSAISKFEQGLNLPKIELLFDYINYFDADPAYLLGCDDNKDKGIDAMLANMDIEAREYLTSVFMAMIENYPSK